MSVWKATEEMYEENLPTRYSKCQIHFMFGYSAVSLKKKIAVMWWWWEDQQKFYIFAKVSLKELSPSNG